MQVLTNGFRLKNKTVYAPMKRNTLILFWLLFSVLVIAQNNNMQNFKVMCYNVENYFDCIDDSLTNDSEYLPSGMRGWNTTKYQTKQAHIGRVITAIGGWEAPAIVGLCEIESEKCLYDLTHYAGLKNLGYKYLHHDSPDARGVDVAMLYQPRQYKPIHDQVLKITFPFDTSSKTRDILFSSGIIPSGDTLHIFVCHFPSRLGGEAESEEKRMYVASVLKNNVDSLFSKNSDSKIIIMGDFNDYPTNKSILKVLNANPISNIIEKANLYNLMYKLHSEGKGSNKHDGEWGALDQMIISGNLLIPTNTINTNQENAHFFDADFLLEIDKKYLGKQPFRTYLGMKYQEGYSDHLPIYADFRYIRKD